MPGLIAVFLRELRLAWTGGGGAALPLGFFAGAASLTPLALGPETEILQSAGPGVIWIALALSSLLPMERMFQADLEDGTLDAYAVSGLALEAVATAKAAAHWLASGLPLALLSPILWIMLQGSAAAMPLVILISLVGSLAFFLFGSIAAALAAGVRRGGMLITLVSLPLYAPVMIFGAAALYESGDGGDWLTPFRFTGAVTLFAMALAPFASAMALRTAID